MRLIIENTTVLKKAIMVVRDNRNPVVQAEATGMIVFFVNVLYNDIQPVLNDWRLSMDYLGAKDTSKRWGVSIRQVQGLCESGRVEGSFRVGTVWAIPADADKPIDRRTKMAKRAEYKE